MENAVIIILLFGIVYLVLLIFYKVVRLFERLTKK